MRDGIGKASPDSSHQWTRFWQSASGFWLARSARRVWSLCAALVAIVVLQLCVQYQLNYWNRDFFNALEVRDGVGLLTQALLLVPLGVANISLAMTSVWGRMTMQRHWREWLTKHLISYWLDNGRYIDLAQVNGEHKIPEYRIAEDARIATDAPIDFAVGLISSLMTSIVFIRVLWNVGGNATLSFLGLTIFIPGYLVISVVVYSGLITAAMMFVGAPLTGVIARKNQAEAELITAAHAVRDVGEGRGLGDDATDAQHALWEALEGVLLRWRKLCWLLVRTTLVSQGNWLLVPIVGLVLCAPKYLSGTVTLGELTQAAAAFALVQSSFGWLVDNYQRVADWTSSVDRVGGMLLALDQLNGKIAPVIESPIPTPIPVTRQSLDNARI